MKILFLSLLLLPLTCYPDEKPTAFVFNQQRPECTLVDGKLVLSRAWPFGSWESCAYAVLTIAQQLDAQKDMILKQLAEEKSKPQPACLGPVLRK